MQQAINEGKAGKKAAECFGISERSVNTAKSIERDAPDLLAEVESGAMTLNAAKEELKKRKEEEKKREEREARQAEKDKRAAERAAAREVADVPDVVMLEHWKRMPEEQRSHILSCDGEKKFNATNMNVDWALWTWNPITGCLHNCDYCYARDIANRFDGEQKFKPALMPERLTAPRNSKIPEKHAKHPRRKNVFVGSMTDLFGRWVPTSWIDRVLQELADNPQWNFLLLTKFPKRLAEFEFPKNAWIGTSIDEQARVKSAEDAFEKVKGGGVRWLSVEPLLEPLSFSRLHLWDWLVIGGASKSSQTPAFYPPLSWVEALEADARKNKLLIYRKPNLFEPKRNTPHV